MQYIFNSNSGYDISNYLLVLKPTGKACQHIWSFKHDFRRTLNAELATRTRPHLSLLNFSALKKNEERIVNCLQRIAMGITPFHVALENFGCYDSSRTIYINVATRDAVRSAVKEMKQAKHLLRLKSGVYPRYIDDPHVSICRGMEPIQFRVGWSLYSNLSFSGGFVANDVILLKQSPLHQRCELIARFPFKSTSLLPKQGKLFE